MSLGENAHRQRSVPLRLRKRRSGSCSGCLLSVSDRGRGQGSSFLRAAAGSPVGHYLCTLAAEGALSLRISLFPFNHCRYSIVWELSRFPQIKHFLSLYRLFKEPLPPPEPWLWLQKRAGVNQACATGGLPVNKCILMMSKHHPPLPLIMQIRDCVLGTGAGEERAGLFAGGFGAAWQSYALD